MASVNKVILIGNCGRDPEVRYLPSGQAVANVSIATSSRRKDRNTGETVEDTQWHRVTFYDRLAEIAGEYVKKGRPIYVEGRLKYGSYTDKTTGVEKNTVDIIATELQLLGGREGMGGPGAGGGGGGEEGYSRPAARPAAAPAAAKPAPAAKGNFDDMDDDIPFCVLKHAMLQRRQLQSHILQALPIQIGNDHARPFQLLGQHLPPRINCQGLTPSAPSAWVHAALGGCHEVGQVFNRARTQQHLPMRLARCVGEGARRHDEMRLQGPIQLWKTHVIANRQSHAPCVTVT